MTENIDKNMNKFLSASNYDTPSGQKKLRFIFKTISRFLEENDIAIKDLSILEVACGEGNIAFPLAALGCQVRCFDISRNAIESINREVAIKGIKNLTATVDDAYTFYDNNRYHIVIASEVFEHVDDPKRLRDNIVRYLDSNSCLIVTVPNGYGPWELSNRLLWYHLTRSNLIRKLFGRPAFSPYPGEIHCQYYTKNQLLNVINMPVKNMSNSNSILTALAPIWSLGKKHLADALDIQLADILPYWLASGWYFEFRADTSKKSTMK
jgi:2-polyprenyl-3-methyl-5-hydroxy-6-metoxy-1,4-benzoquinol methylase